MVAKALNALGQGTCISIAADLQHLSEVDRLVKEISDRETVLHVLVNNAGAAWGETIDDYPVSTPLCLSELRTYKNVSRTLLGRSS